MFKLLPLIFPFHLYKVTMWYSQMYPGSIPETYARWPVKVRQKAGNNLQLPWPLSLTSLFLLQEALGRTEVFQQIIAEPSKFRVEKDDSVWCRVGCCLSLDPTLGRSWITVSLQEVSMGRSLREQRQDSGKAGPRVSSSSLLTWAMRRFIPKGVWKSLSSGS